MQTKEKRAPEIATWKGSTATASMVLSEIIARYGEEEAKNYNPLENCLTFNTWRAKGYTVKKGEKAIRSVTWIDGEKKKGDGTIETKKFPRTVCLFYHLQVEKTQ